MAGIFRAPSAASSFSAARIPAAFHAVVVMHQTGSSVCGAGSTSCKKALSGASSSLVPSLSRHSSGDKCHAGAESTRARNTISYGNAIRRRYAATHHDERMFQYRKRWRITNGTLRAESSATRWSRCACCRYSTESRSNAAQSRAACSPIPPPPTPPHPPARLLLPRS